MKAAEFEYIRAASIADVCEALAGDDGEAERKIIAGGQTLVPLMAMRMARPTLLIDINEIEELRGISVSGDRVSIRAGTRQRMVENSREVSEALPLLSKAIKFVGHQQTRNRGTVGGSIVHGDPSAEIPLVALTLDAALHAQSSTGTKELAADGFFESAMVTGLAPDQCLTEITFPLWNGGGRIGTGFHEVSSRQSDFAVVATAAQVQLDADGTCRRAAIGAGGVAATPVRLRALEAALTGARLDDATVTEALDSIEADIDPETDLHASADYRRRVVRQLAARAILDAAKEASS